MAEVTTNDAVRGFKGAMSGLPLSDVIQLKGHNMFTGCIFVEYGNMRGSIYFKAGEVVHAEQGAATGEHAFYEIVSWPGGQFDIKEQVVAQQRTIDRKLTFLLLEAHRLLDEGRLSNAQPQEAAAGDGGKAKLTVNTLCHKLMTIPGVTHAVMFNSDGRPLEDISPTAVNLASQGRVLTDEGGKLGELFGVGALKSLAVHDKKNQVLLFEVKNLFLSLAVSGEMQLGQVETELRKSFAARR